MNLREINMEIKQFAVNRRNMLWPSMLLLIVISFLVYFTHSLMYCDPVLIPNEEMAVVPINITVVGTTSSSVMMKWPENKMTSSPEELIYKIEYKSQRDIDYSVMTINISGICSSSLTSDNSVPNCGKREAGYFYFNVSDLKYPFSDYVFCLYLSVGNGDENKWPMIGNIRVKTGPSIPIRSPTMDVGSYSISTSADDSQTRDVVIYWQEIEEDEKCGDSFQYIAYCIAKTENKSSVIYSNEISTNYAVFKELNSDIEYEFTVYSSNTEGSSFEYSTILVPSAIDQPTMPMSPTKMVFADQQNVIEISWFNIRDQKQMYKHQQSDLSVFWCEIDVNRPRICKDKLKWTHLSNTKTRYNITDVDSKKNYLFAVSANSYSTMNNNTKLTSSGMSWVSCSVQPNKIVERMNSIWVNFVSSTFLELRWLHECSDRIGKIQGYRLLYCPITSMTVTTCIEPMTNKQISGDIAHRDRTFAFVRNLKPYTTYMITISLITNHGESLPSNPIFKTTLEGAPDIRNVNVVVTSLTNTSVDLQWTPPKFMNGIVRHYIIHYSLDETPLQQQQQLQKLQQEEPQQKQDLIDLFDEQKLSYEQHNVTVSDTKYCLTNLESYASYNISVTACTTKCSERSFPLQIRTAVGKPGKVVQPKFTYENGTKLLVTWQRPIKPGGPIDYYQLVVAPHNGSENSQITNGTLSPSVELDSALSFESSKNILYQGIPNICYVSVPECNIQDENRKSFYLAVRAVNNNPVEPLKPYYGQWTVPGSVDCVSPDKVSQ